MTVPLSSVPHPSAHSILPAHVSPSGNVAESQLTARVYAELDLTSGSGAITR